MRTDHYEDELETAKELHEFLQGNIPEGYKIPEGHVPNLNADQAATVVWYLGNLYKKISDCVERCGVCGEYFHTSCEGEINDHAPGPVHVCGNCLESDEAIRQRRIGRHMERVHRKASIIARKEATK